MQEAHGVERHALPGVVEQGAIKLGSEGGAAGRVREEVAEVGALNLRHMGRERCPGSRLPDGGGSHCA